MRSGTQVLRLSARTGEALDDFRSALATELAGPDTLDLSDVASTLGGRRKEKIRMAAVVHDQHDAATVLRATEHDNVFIGEAVDDAASGADRVVLLFPGQGAQHAEMARGLYDTEPVFAESFDRCAEGFLEELGIDLRKELFDATGSDLERTDRAQPALFAVEYALGKVIEFYGVRAAALAGHSIGEYAAATLAGVFDLPAAIKTVAVRARLMHASAPGAMVAVAMSPDVVAEHLSPGLDLAAVNDPGNCVIAGSHENIRKFANDLRQQGVLARRVRTSHAFHSNLMDPVVGEFEQFLSQVELHKPHTPLLSNVTGSWLTDEQATDPATWARQIRATVRFSDELDLILAEPSRVLVEVGPGGALTGSAIRHPKWSNGHRAVRLMRHQVQNRSDRDTFLLSLGQLWSAGIEVDWSPLSSDRPQLVSLPGYPFARQRHWVDPKKTTDWADAPASPNGSTATSSNGAAVHPAAGKSGQSEIETTLQRIWRECLGVNSIGLKDNFFEIGGDSLFAIGVAMSAANQGLDLTPQDLYENQTVSTLSAALVARYAAGGLASVPAGEDETPPVPPNIAYFLEHGLREAGRWCVPLILRLDSKVGMDDVRSVLIAVVNHHDALRLRIVERAGSWEQHIAPPYESIELARRSLPEGVARGSAEEREAVLEVLGEDIRARDLSSPPLSATYIVDSEGDPCCLAITVLEMVADSASREILLTDLFTAFGQHVAGQAIALPAVTTTWREWSHRCATLTTHPAVLASRDYWLENSTRTTIHVADHHVADPPRTDDLTRLGSTMTAEQTSEIDRARRMFQFTVEEVLLGGLSRTIAHTTGEGVVAVSLPGDGRSVLKPDVDARRCVGGFATIFPMLLTCAGRGGSEATQILNGVHDTLKAVPHQGLGHGLLRYLYGPTARTLSLIPPPDIFLSNEGMIPDLPPGDGPVQFDLDTAMSVRDKVPGLGHALEIRVYRSAGQLHVDWWYDSRRLQREAVEALAGHLPIALSELIDEAMASIRADGELGGTTEELGLVDLSAE
jgi:phthiocerol/phenolphthiocerol synthesis type-I polyketide synthase E